MASVSAVLLGLIAGYVVAYSVGMVNFGNIGRAAIFAVPNPLHFGIEFSAGAKREATEEELRGATFADGLGTALSGLFGGLPNTSFSQNVGLIAMTQVMSRHVVTIGALFLIIAGLIPKVGAAISTVPIEVLGGGVIVMFGMVAAAGISMLSEENWTRRNVVIFAISLAVGLGLQQVPQALQHLPVTAKVLLTSGLLPAAFLVIFLNLILPEQIDEIQTEEVSGGLSGGSSKAN